MRSAKVVPRGCSRPLKRVIVDFAADQSFALARMKLLEHYGFEIGESTIQRVALGHAKTVFEAGGASQDFPRTVGRHKEIVAQSDGGMIPIVEPDASQKDKRKGKTLSWREAKICLATPRGAKRRSTTARSRAASKPPDESFSHARGFFAAREIVARQSDGAICSRYAAERRPPRRSNACPAIRRQQHYPRPLHLTLRGTRCSAARLKHLALLRRQPNCFGNHPDDDSPEKKSGY
jgi:hypothetical protein